MTKLKVLIIPSWYPNEKDPLWGNYFIKQAEVLNEYADVSMLYVNRLGLREIKKINKERITDGYDNDKYSFKFYKKTILNYKSLSIDYSFKKYMKAGYNAYKKLELFIDKPDIILVESVLPAGLIAKYISKKEGIPYIVHEHSLNIMSNPLYTKYVNDIIKDADNYMAVNQNIVDAINKKRKKQCKLVPNFIDTKKFDVKKSKNNKRFELINVCNFYKVKALDVLLKAMDIVVNKKGHKDVFLKIVGTGEYRDFYESIMHSLRLDSNVEFVGYVNNNKLPELYANANVLCVSSTFETFCIPIIEALSSGIPVITTNCDGPSLIVDDTVSLTVPINDIEKYADAIIEMKENYKKYNSKKLKKYAYSRYDKSVICKQILNICDETINSK